LRFFDFDRDGLTNGLKFAQRGIELDALNAMCYCVRGFCQMYLGDLAAAGESYHKAASLNPGDSHIHVEGALLHIYLGRLPVSREYLGQAFRLNPLPPLWYGEFAAVLHFVEGSYQKALPSFLAVPEGAWDCMYALACLGHLGDSAQARSLIDRYRPRRWDFFRGAAAEPFVDPEPRQRLIQGLKKALEA
jgi:tetratricopeptide (TPR) repeat protein